jgi:hypothetical protein
MRDLDKNELGSVYGAGGWRSCPPKKSRGGHGRGGGKGRGGKGSSSSGGGGRGKKCGKGGSSSC